MPRPQRGGATLLPPTNDPLAAIADDIDSNLSYGRILAEHGARRDPRKGIVHDLPFGQPFRRGGRWIQQTKTYRVAMSAEEARQKTRATGERWDYFEPGAECDRCLKAGGDGIVSGWVLGGRKFQVEHDHVTTFDPTVYGEVEVAAPDIPDEDMAADEAPVLVEA